MNSNPNPMANAFRARNVQSSPEAKNGFRAISGNNYLHMANDSTQPSAPISPGQHTGARPMPRTPQHPNFPQSAANGANNARPTGPQPSQQQQQQQHTHAGPQTLPQQPVTPPRPASSSPPSTVPRTPSPHSTPPSQPGQVSPSPSPQRSQQTAPPRSAPWPQTSAPSVPSYGSANQHLAPQQHQLPYNSAGNVAQMTPVNHTPVNQTPANYTPASQTPAINVLPPQQQVISDRAQTGNQAQMTPVTQQPTAIPLHEQQTQEDLSIPDDMLMALDDAEARLTADHGPVAPTNAVPHPQSDQHSMQVPQGQVTPVNQQPAPVPVTPEPAPRPVMSPPNDELDRLRHEVTLLRQERAKDDVQRVTAQLQNTRADVTLLRTQLNNTARTDQELRREMERLKEQLAWKDQELREVRMSVLDQPAAPTDAPLAASDGDHVVYNVNTESDESESHSVNDQSTHVLNLRMKVGTGNTQAAANTSSVGKHSPTNLQQLQLQGTKNRSPTATKTAKPAPSPSVAPSKKASVPSKGHKRSRDEMSRAEDPDEPMLDPVNKENTQLKRALYKAKVRLHNIKKAVLTEAPEEKSHSPNLDQLKTELLDCIQLQMTSQFDALKAEIAGLALARAADDVTEPAAKRRKTDQSASTDQSEPALVESLRAQIEQLTRQQQSAHEEADKTRQTNESLNHMMAELKKLKDEDRTRAEKLSDENRALSEQVAALEALHAQLARTSETSAEHERVKEQLSTVQDELGKVRDELTAVRARAEAADRQLEVSEQRVVELDQLFRDQCAETTRVKEENAKLQQECDKLKTVAKQLYLKIKNSAGPALSTSGALAASTEGPTDEPRQ